MVCDANRSGFREAVITTSGISSLGWDAASVAVFTEGVALFCVHDDSNTITPAAKSLPTDGFGLSFE
jgi:hypothetical protein